MSQGVMSRVQHITFSAFGQLNSNPYTQTGLDRRGLGVLLRQQSIAVSQFRVCTLRVRILSAITTLCRGEGCPNSKCSPNASHKCALFLPVFECALLQPFMVSHVPRFIAHPKIRNKYINNGDVKWRQIC